MKRRNFIGQNTDAAGAVSAANISRRPLKAATRKNASDRILLGWCPQTCEKLRGLLREKVTPLSKTDTGTHTEMKADLERFRLELNIDYIGRLRGKVGESLQFALSLDGVGVFTIGDESRAEMEDLVRKIPAASMRG